MGQIFWAASSNPAILLASCGQTPVLVRVSSYFVCIVIVLTVVFPKTHGANLIIAATM